jgi:hypothetical protein
MPKEKPLVMKVCGERPPTELVGSPGSGGWANCESSSFAHWKRPSLMSRLDRVEVRRRFSESEVTKSLP